MLFVRPRCTVYVIHWALMVAMGLLARPLAAQPPALPPTTGCCLTASGSLSFGAWQEGRGVLWQALHGAESTAIPCPVPPSAPCNATNPGQRPYSVPYPPAALNPVTNNNCPVSPSDPRCGAPSASRDLSSNAPYPATQSSCPTWPAPVNPSYSAAPAPTAVAPSGQTASQFSQPATAWGSATRSPQSMAAQPNAATTPLAPPASMPSPPATSTPGYATAQSSPWIGGAQPPAAPPQTPAPAEDPRAKIQRLRQQYQIGKTAAPYMGSHDLSRYPEAPRWTGPTANAAPSR